jgi:hypothetical protein
VVAVLGIDGFAFGIQAMSIIFGFQGTTLGWLLLIPTAVAFLLMARSAYRLYGARALPWQQPRLLIDDKLDEDDQSQVSRQFRLRVRLRKGEAKVIAQVDRVLDERGRDFPGTANLPIQLHWSNNDGQPVMSLSSGQLTGDTFGLCAVRVIPGEDGPGMVITGHRREPGIPRFFEDNRIIWLQVSVIAGKERVERRFGFQPDTTSPMLCRAWAGDPPVIRD